MDADGSEVAVLNSNAFLIPLNTQYPMLWAVFLIWPPNLDTAKDNANGPKG